MQVILSSNYMPPIEYFLWTSREFPVIIDLHENYIKQSYRNRCSIYTSNGMLSLAVPVSKTTGHHTKVADISLQGSDRWKHNHWRALKSAYSSSPFFLYYADEIKSILFSRHNSLSELNKTLFEEISNLAELKIRVRYSTSYISGDGQLDLRKHLHPKLASPVKFLEYTQVFKTKFGFIPNLSILDLMFNKGPETANYLQKCLNINRWDLIDEFYQQRHSF